MTLAASAAADFAFTAAAAPNSAVEAETTNLTSPLFPSRSRSPQ